MVWFDTVFQKAVRSLKKIVIGILAHVDSGKTTLSEAMLYQAGQLKKMGRVDHRDSFLDTFSLERERGITIFSKQALFQYGDTSFTLLDTPGHVDFSAETERTLQVLDYAVLVIGATDGVQSHTLTLWKLLQKYRVPCFIFVNKMDLAGAEKELALVSLQGKFGDRCIDFTSPDSKELYEAAASCDEQLLEIYDQTDHIPKAELIRAIKERRIFPCLFGSALKDSGVKELLQTLSAYTEMPSYGNEFAGKVFKIAEDKQRRRLTFLKITGGTLRVREVLTSEKNTENEKVSQIRLYSGEKFTTAEEVSCGSVCAVTGIRFALPGDGVGTAESSGLPVLTPVLTYSVVLPEGMKVHTALEKLRLLEEEDPQLQIMLNERFGTIQVRLMGEIQLEILKAMIADRFGFTVGFDQGSIIYKETITQEAEGIGHFEPLRHYAEVHLLLRPGKRSSGLIFKTDCREDLLDRNWQRLVLSNLYEKTHIGVLTGSPITDMEIILTAGRAHTKHTEGGDFRQATLRAVRNGLRFGASVLLEPYYDFTLEVPEENVGRAISDIQKMSGSFEQPETTTDGSALIHGKAPVSEMNHYSADVIQYTHGRGKLSCTFSGYEECHNAEEVIASFDYDPDRDTDNPCDSVFCSHGAGYIVKWDQVRDHAHIKGSALHPETDSQTSVPERLSRAVSQKDVFAQDKELMAIFEKTYGPVKRRQYRETQEIFSLTDKDKKKDTNKALKYEMQQEYVLVDGYNVIFSWEHLKKTADTNIDAARAQLTNILCNYQGYKKCELILVFDAYKVRGGIEKIEKEGNIHIVYTKEAETADMYIEKVTHELAKKHRVRVVTSDRLEQIIILGNGALRISSNSFLEEVRAAEKEIRELIDQ